MVQYEIQRDIATIGSTGAAVKKLSLISWNKYPAKLDLRSWIDGKPGKGLTLSAEEARTLLNALTAFLNEDNPEHCQ